MKDASLFRNYQHAMIRHQWDVPFNACWCPLGSGKTVSTLTAIKEMRDAFEIDRTLVIAPLRVARKVWTDEILEWAHLQGLSTAKIIGNATERNRALAVDADIHLINRENVRWLVDQHIRPAGKTKTRGTRYSLTARWRWDNVIIDESRSFQNHSSERFKALRRMLKFIRRMTQLTGTPATNGLMGLWAQLYLLDRGQRLLPTITAFRDRWFDSSPYNPHVYTPKPFAEEEIFERVADICMTLRAEDLFGKDQTVYNAIRVELSEDEMRRYQQFKRSYVLDIGGQEITAVTAGALWGRLLQLCSGAVYTEHPKWEAFHNHKISALMELLDTLSEQVIVVYNYKSDLARIEAALVKARLNYRVLKTEADEQAWNTGKIDVLLIHPMSAGHGLNLHVSGAKTLIHFSMNADLDQYLQVNARLFGGHRGAGKQGIVHHIVADGTLDEDVLAMLQDKEGVQRRLMDATRRLIEEVGS